MENEVKTEEKQESEAPREVLTKIKLNKMFGSMFGRVLDDSYLKRLPKEKRGAVSKYEVLKPLPSKEEFNVLFHKHHQVTLEDLHGAYSEIEELASEMEEWASNMPEGLQQSDKYYQIEEARDTLQNCQDPGVNCDALEEIMSEFRVTFVHSSDTSSRPKRRDEAISKLQALKDALEGQKEELIELAKSKKADEMDDISTDSAQEEIDSVGEEVGEAIDALVGELDNHIGEIEGVEFPGMFG